MRKSYIVYLLILIFSFFSCSNPSNSGSETTESDFGIKYTFYLSSTTDQSWASVSGLEGSIVPAVTSPKKRGYRFTGWKTKSGDSIPAVFGKEKLSFYAHWVESNSENLIGTKSYPDAVGDVIFTDGSASSYPEDWSDLTANQWKNAVAMVFTTTYNPSNGQNVKGAQYQYKIAAGLVVAKEKEWCVKYTYVADGRDSSASTWESIKNEQFIMTYIGYSWDNNSYKTGNVLPALNLSPYFGKQNLVDSKKFQLYATKEILPAFEYAINYGKRNNSLIDTDFQNDWYLPSSGELKVLLGDETIRKKYERLLTKVYSERTLTSDNYSYSIPDNTWSSSTDPNQNPERFWISKEEDYHYGVLAGNTIATNTQVWIFDPYSGLTAKPKVPIYTNNGEQNGKFVDKPVKNWNKITGAGYEYQFNFYSQAYKVNSSGYSSFDKKTVKHAVIPVRVF